jgi:hypothetical protein
LLKDLFIIRCGYCNEELYTRYAATYHLKYKHPGEERYFIKDEQDVTKFYVNRANFNSNTTTTSSSSSSILNVNIKDANSSSSSASSISSNDENHQSNSNNNDNYGKYILLINYYIQI